MMNLSARNITKSDTPGTRFTMVLVTTTPGTLVVEKEGGQVDTLQGIPTNVWIPVGNATNIRTTSTSDGYVVI